MKHWVENEEIDLPSESFFDEIELICRKYGLSISHEDGHGAFEIEPFEESNIDWLRGANFSKRAAQIINQNGDLQNARKPNKGWIDSISEYSVEDKTYTASQRWLLLIVRKIMSFFNLDF